MTTFLAVCKWIGWRGFLALAFLVMGLLTMADRDAQARRADQADARIAVLDQLLGRKNDALRTCSGALRRDAVQFKSMAENTSGWNSAIDTVSGVLLACQSENVRLSAAAAGAQRKAAAVEAAARKRLSTSLQKWDSRSAECTAAAKLMEAKCEGL